MTDIEIGKRIREIRQSYGMTQKEFGQEIGKTAGYVCLLEKGNIFNKEILNTINEKFDLNEKWVETDENWLEPEIADGAAERIRTIRKMAGFTQGQLADYLSRPERQIAGIECGDREVSMEFLRLLSDRMNVPLSYLVLGEPMAEKWVPPVDTLDDDIKDIIIFLLSHKKMKERFKAEIEEYSRENQKALMTGTMIKRGRKEKGLTQRRLGELVGRSEKVIGSYEEGRANPPSETLEKIIAVLDLCLD